MVTKLNKKLSKLKNFFLLVIFEESKKFVSQSKAQILNFKNTVQWKWYYFKQLLKLIIELSILPTKKLIWGVQIQSFKTTLFALGFSLFLTIYFSFLSDLSDSSLKDYAEGATQIMIAIGTSLMAMAIFVFESIARKRRYFDKYFLLGITNIFNLVILFFIGLFLLIFHYFDTPFISHFVKNFIDIYIYCLLLIALAVIRIYKTAMGLLYRDNAKKIEEEIVIEFDQSFFSKIDPNSREYTMNAENKFFFFLKDYSSNTLNKMKNINLEEIKDLLIISVIIFLI